jgi:methylthioribose-1-phosphate isomerase
VTDLQPHEIVRLDAEAVVVLDQRLLPDEVAYLECRSAREVAVRGAPAIGIAAAYGYALAGARGDELDDAAALLLAARPTAVNLPWALAEMRQGDQSPPALAARAQALHDAEVERCRRMAFHAAGLFEPDTRALTHCNAGALATGGIGSALGAIREGFERGLVTHVFVDETRPLLQGARLTARASLTAWSPTRRPDP